VTLLEAEKKARREKTKKCRQAFGALRHRWIVRIID